MKAGTKTRRKTVSALGRFTTETLLSRCTRDTFSLMAVSFPLSGP